MRRVRRATMVAAVFVVILGAVPYTRHLMLGLLRKEAFYDGRPTSYWRSTIVELPTTACFIRRNSEQPGTGSGKRSGVGFQLSAWLRRIGLYRSDDGSLPL